MAKDVLVYLSFHEPRRLRLPVEPIPPEVAPGTIRDCVFDEEETQYFFRRWLEEVGKPYTLLFERLVEDGAAFLVSVSGPLLRLLAENKSSIAADFVRLLRHPRLGIVCSAASNSISQYLDIELFHREMERGRQFASDLLGRAPVLAAAPLMSINNEIYHVCEQVGFRGVIVDGTWDLLKGRSSDRIYRNGNGPLLLVRNSDLSLQTAAMLAELNQSSYSFDSFPLTSKVIGCPSDHLLLGWQVSLLNGRQQHADECSILERSLHNMIEHGISFPTADDVLTKEDRLYPSLQLPALPSVASEYGNIFYFLGHPAQQAVFCLMRQAYSVARLTQSQELIDLATDMAQWDLLGLLHHLTVSNGNYDQPHYFTPTAWRRFGTNEILSQLPQLYEHFVQRVTDSYL